METLPCATQFMQCASQCSACNELEHRYNNACWVPRTDVIPPITPRNDKNFPSQASWHPGNRVHQLKGRKIALAMLHGLKVAIETWKEGIDTDGFPLKERYWYVGSMY